LPPDFIVVGKASKVARQHFLAGLPPSLVAVHFVFTSALANEAHASVGIPLVPHAQVSAFVTRQRPFLVLSVVPVTHFATSSAKVSLPAQVVPEQVVISIFFPPSYEPSATTAFPAAPQSVSALANPSFSCSTSVAPLNLNYPPAAKHA